MKQFAALIVVALALAGCMSGQGARVVTATPAPTYLPYTPAPGEFSPQVAATDQAQQIKYQQSTADAMAARFTQEAIISEATQAAQTQAAIMQAQQFTHMTQTAIAVIANQTAAPATSTALAVALAREIATVEAAHATATQSAIDAEVAAIQLQERREDAERTRQQREIANSMFGVLMLVIVGAAVAIVGILVLAVNRFVAIKAYQAQNAASVHFLPDVGIMIVDGEPVPLPGMAAALPARAATADDITDRLTINSRGGDKLTGDKLRERLQLNQERAARGAWRVAMKNFLLWGERLGGFSMRSMRDGAGIEDAAWRDVSGLLEDLGYLEKTNRGTRLAFKNQQGDRWAVGDILSDPNFTGSSFPYPAGDAPTIRKPPTHHTTPHTPTHTHTHPHTRHTQESGGKSTKIVGGRWDAEINPPPMTFDELMEDAERKRRLLEDDDEFEAG